jgi:hypothetical protein
MADLRISTDPQRLAERRAERQRKQRLNYIVGGVVAALAAFVGLVVATNLSSDSPPPPEPPPQVANQPAKQPTRDAEAVKSPSVRQVDDDGSTLWVSPTNGSPLSLAWLPTGTQLVLSVRPASLDEAGELDKVVAALGPSAAAARQWLEQTAGTRAQDLERITIGLRPASEFRPEWVVVCEPTALLRESPPAKFSGEEPSVAGDIAHWRASNTAWVITTPSLLDELRQQAGQPPGLRRELEVLAVASDAERQITLVTAPSFLFGEGRAILAAEREPLAKLLIPLLTNDIKGICLSLHWNQNFFVELLVAPTGGTKPRDVAATFAAELARWPSVAEESIIGLAASEYGRRVVARLPAMLRLLSRYARSDIERTHAVLRCYLPKPAGHSLLMGTELLMSYHHAGPSIVAGGAATPTAAQSLEERLDKTTTLVFNRDTLEMAIKLLSDDTGIPITINGGDLQLDGITKNQSFGIDARDRPARDILVEILRKANPDVLATGPDDIRQKLVYVEGPSDTIVVTTRAAAAKRGDPLPAVFVPRQ